MASRALAPALALAAAIAVPMVFPSADYTLAVLFLIFLYATLAAGWNIIGGFGGQISFGHAAFLGIGAYTSAILTGAGWSIYASMPVAGLLAAAFSLLIGPPCFRLHGPYFTIATIGIGEAMRLIALNANRLTGGASGLTLAAAPAATTQYYIALAACASSIAVSAWISRSRFGYALAALKADRDAAETLGVNTTIAKTQALVLSAFIVGVGGSIYAMHYLYVSPDSVFGFSTAISLVIMPIIGGVGTVWGPFLGSIVFTFIREQMEANFANVDLLAFGALLIAIVLYEPRGLVGALARLRRPRGEGATPPLAGSA